MTLIHILPFVTTLRAVFAAIPSLFCAHSSRRPVDVSSRASFTRATVFIALTGLALPAVTWAGTGGAEFNGAYTTLTTWLQGDLGRLIAAALLVVGLIMGVVRQSIMAAVPAIACGLVATIAPTIIGAVVTATI